ncbi:hypothetical protein BSKO_01907 [Bryopsis sp. KO-2023]|nr:hypothetical protein BSKO_01907 [Bryopsis sp. KO-2023]
MNTAAAKNLLSEISEALDNRVPPHKDDDVSNLEQELLQHEKEAQRLGDSTDYEIAVRCHIVCRNKIQEVLARYRKERRKRILNLCHKCFPLPKTATEEWSADEQKYAREIQARMRRKPTADWVPVNLSTTEVTITQASNKVVNTGTSRYVLGQGTTFRLPDAVAGTLVAEGIASGSVWQDCNSDSD